MYMYEKGKSEGELGILGFLFSKVFPMSTVRKKKIMDCRSVVDVEELQCEYERYRILVLNEFDRGMHQLL